ncbi:MAG TPA: hypothetical protein PKY77_13845 [Phycisphaerae bacterium]|nr:hypothetical protein [Phycisphaerae bacterium]HRY70480.1 hypothetical protein [Phycisphaerae bacterium]HSA28209.1 hypothetical protein [Phycisphaerae bacterium]
MAAAGVCHGEGGEPGVASTAADPSDGLRDELSRRGITEPKLSELAKMPGLAAGIVRQLAGRIGRAMNPAGKLIALIEREGPAAVAAAESAAANAVRAANASAARIATDEAKAAEVALERLERHRLLATLAPAELDAYVRRVLDAATTAERQRWDGNTDPARNRLLGQRVVALVLAERAAANGGDQP